MLTGAEIPYSTKFIVMPVVKGIGPNRTGDTEIVVQAERRREALLPGEGEEDK
jgi:hypothetical protein